MNLFDIRINNKKQLFNPFALHTYYKGGSVPPPPDPMKEAEARMMEERERARLAAEAEARAAEKAKIERGERISNNRARLNTARQNADAYGLQRLQSRGLNADSYGLNAAYRSALDRAANNFQEDAQSFSDPFSQSLFDDVFNTAQSQERRKLRNQFSEFAGDGFENSMFADTSDDRFIDAILNDQFAEAQDTVNRAAARGTLNPGSLSYAQQELNRARTSGRARAEDMGLGVLQGYRNQLTNEAKRGNARIDQYELGDQFNIDNLKGNITGLQSRLNNRLEGDIYNAISGTSFFDTDKIIGKSANRGGISNGTNAPLGGSSFSSPTQTNDDLTRRQNTGTF